MGTFSAEISNTRGNRTREVVIPEQLDHSVPPGRSNLHSVSASDIEESISNLQSDIVEDSSGRNFPELDELGEQFVDTLVVKFESADKNDPRQRRNPREKVITLYLLVLLYVLVIALCSLCLATDFKL